MRDGNSISVHNPIRRVRPSGAGHKTRQTFIPDRGFSLIETVAVLGVVLIVAAMALPLVQSSLTNYQLRASASTISGVIQSTRYSAVSQGYPFQVVFDKNANTYQLLSDPTCSGTFASVAPPFDKPIPIGNTSTTLGANTTLQFSGGGSVKSVVGAMTLVLTRSGKTGTITVSNYGNVKVVYGP